MKEETIMNNLISKIFNKHTNNGEFVHVNGLKPLANTIENLQKNTTPTNAIIKIEAGTEPNTLVTTSQDDTKNTITIKTTA